MTKIPSREPSGTYGHGPLKICFWKGKDDDHDQDFLKKDLLHIWSWSSDKSFSKSGCDPLCCKNVCRASRFCMGGRGAAGSRSKNLLGGPWSKMLAQGTIWGSEMKVEAGAGAAHRTGKPGQSAHAGSTQGVFLWQKHQREYMINKVYWKNGDRSTLEPQKHFTHISSKPKGPGEEAAPRNHPEIWSRKVADFECAFPYDSYGRHFYFSHRPSPPINSTLWSNTLQRVDFGSILGQFFGQFRSKMTKTDQKPTENRLKTDPLQDPDRRLPLRRGEGLWLK